jgi:hypothetical protein
MVPIDFEMTVEEAIMLGKYDWVSGDITHQDFPHDQNRGKMVMDIVLHHLDRCTKSSGEVIVELDRLGMRPATLMELLAFGAVNPELQQQFPIIALGTVASSHRSFPCLDSKIGKRNLCLRGGGDRWHADYRFAAVFT